MKTPLLSDITTRLASLSESPALEASVLLGHILDRPRTWVLSHPELKLTNEQTEKLYDSLTRLERGESFPYVLGHWEFFGLDFEITPDVLIPRPETELLVEKAIGWLRKNPEQKNIADVGTGSGAIAISLAVNVPDAKIIATDISPEALRVAIRNAEKNSISEKVTFIECDLLPPRSSIQIHRSKFDVLCANLPYIPTKTLESLQVFGREPTLALDGGADGFELIRRLMLIVPEYLSPGSLMLFEIEETLGKEAIALAEQFFPNAQIVLHKDLAQRNRLLEVQLQ